MEAAAFELASLLIETTLPGHQLKIWITFIPAFIQFGLITAMHPMLFSTHGNKS